MSTNIIKPGREENLHKIMEVLEGVAERTAELQGKADQVDELQGTISRLEAKCKDLDGKLSRGNKVFAGSDSVPDSALRSFGRTFTAAWRLRHYGKLEQGYARAGGTPGQDTVVGNNTGGVLVPTEVYGDVIRLVGEASIIRKIATVIPMTSGTMNVPTRTTGPTVYWASTEGGGPGTKSTVALVNASLTSKTLIAIDEISSELDEDSIVALEPFFATVFAEAVAAEENKQAFSASTPFSGVCQVVNAAADTTTIAMGTTKVAFSDVGYTDLVRLQYAVDANSVGKGVFVMNSQAFKEIVGLKDTQGRPIFATSYNSFSTDSSSANPAAAIATTLLGRPCYLTNAMPQSAAGGGRIMALYGDFSKFAFGDRRALSVDFSDQVYFDFGTIGLRVTERIALKPLITGAFAILKTAAA